MNDIDKLEQQKPTYADAITATEQQVKEVMEAKAVTPLFPLNKKASTMKWVKYRVVRYKYAEFEVQKWRLWFPIWIQVGINTFPSFDSAKKCIEVLKKRDNFKKKVVYKD